MSASIFEMIYAWLNLHCQHWLMRPVASWLLMMDFLWFLPLLDRNYSRYLLSTDFINRGGSCSFLEPLSSGLVRMRNLTRIRTLQPRYTKQKRQSRRTVSFLNPTPCCLDSDAHTQSPEYQLPSWHSWERFNACAFLSRSSKYWCSFGRALVSASHCLSFSPPPQRLSLDTW